MVRSKRKALAPTATNTTVGGSAPSGAKSPAPLSPAANADLPCSAEVLAALVSDLDAAQGQRAVSAVKNVSKALHEVSIKDTDRVRLSPAFADLCERLGDLRFVQHSSKDVRLLTACALADVMRICAPDVPYEEPVLRAVFRLFIGLLRTGLARTDGKLGLALDCFWLFSFVALATTV